MIDYPLILQIKALFNNIGNIVIDGNYCHYKISNKYLSYNHILPFF